MLILSLLLQAAVATPGLPPQPPATMVVEPVGMLIATFDTDGDARVTKAELEAGVASEHISTSRSNIAGLVIAP